MNNIISKMNSRTTSGMAAFVISGAYLASRLLGLLRDRLLASHFGIGATVDAYTAAFRLPDLLLTLLVSGAFAVAFIPVISEHLERGEMDQVAEITSSVLNFFALLNLVLGVALFIFAEPVTRLITPGFDPDRHRMTVELTRIMLITPICFALSNVLGSLQQAFRRFMFFAFASVIYNLGIIAGIIWLSPHYGIYGVAYGVVIGAILQALMQLLGMIGLGYKYSPIISWRSKSFRQVYTLLIPRSLDQGIDQLNYTAQTIVGSSLATGSLTAYYYANNLKNVPLVIFGNAIATAAFPNLAAQAARRDKTGIIEGLVVNARLILFLVIPATAVAVIMRGYIVRLLFGFGNATTASTLGWFAGTIIFQSLFFIVTRVFYALQDSRTPLYTSIIAIGVNIVLSILLGHRYGVAGLAMAQSLIATIETFTLLYLLRRRMGHIGGRQILSGVLRIVLATVIMSSVIYILVARVLPLYALDRGILVVGPKFAFILIAGLLSYLLPCYVLQLREAKSFVSKLKTQLMRPINALL